MFKITLSLLFTILLVVNLHSQIYVDSTGSDFNTGNISSPFQTLSKAISVADAGDTIFVRGGIYNPTTTISINKNGTTDKIFYLLAYPGERPILDFYLLPYNSSNRGIKLSANYWYIKGFDIKSAGDNGMHISGSNNIIEFCSFYENYDTGLQLSNGASNNKIINCDSYFNADPNHGNADGFAPKLDVGTGNYFYGCRAWQNSDDGWDGYMRGANDVSTTLENCWCFKNGYLKDGTKSQGNGNGFKLGGGDNGNSDTLCHNFTLKRCLAFDNVVKGFDQNNNRGSMTLLNCTGYNNGINYSVPKPLNTGKSLIVKNCVELGSKISLGNFAEQEKNSWLAGFNVSNEDFISINPEQAYGPRKEDGSLPEIDYLHLAEGSDLIDAGVNINLSFNGIAPDLGAFESDYTTFVENSGNKKIHFSLDQNYPNPFNPSTTIKFSLPEDGNVKIHVYNTIGKLVSVLFNGYRNKGLHQIHFNAIGLASGIYFYQISFGKSLIIKKMTLLR